MTGLPTVGSAGWGDTLNDYLSEREAYFHPESYGAVGDGTTDDTDALQDCVAAAVAVSGTVVLGTKTYAVSDEIQFVGTDNAASLVGQGFERSVIKALTSSARLSWSTRPTGSGTTGITLYGRPSLSHGWKFDGDNTATRGIFIGPAASHGTWSNIWSTKVDGDAWEVCPQNTHFISCIGDEASGNAWTLDYGIQACVFTNCHGLSADGWQWQIRQSGGSGWGNSAQPQDLLFLGGIAENEGAPSFDNTGLGGVHIREGLDITFKRFDFVTTSAADDDALVLTPSTANGYVGRITLDSCRATDIHIDANSGGAAQSMGGTNEPLHLAGWNVITGAITNGSTGPVYNSAARNAVSGAVSYATEGTGVPYKSPVTIPISPNLMPTGAIAETTPRSLLNGAAQTLASGTMRLTAIPLRRGDVVSSITYVSGTTAGATLTRTWFALYDANRNKLGVTAEDTSASWAANTARTLAMSTPYTVPTTGVYYVAIVVVGTTMPTLSGFNAGAATPVALAPILTGTSSTGQTTAASAADPAAAITATVNTHYAYVS